MVGLSADTNKARLLWLSSEWRLGEGNVILLESRRVKHFCVFTHVLILAASRFSGARRPITEKRRTLSLLTPVNAPTVPGTKTLIRLRENPSVLLHPQSWLGCREYRVFGTNWTLVASVSLVFPSLARQQSAQQSAWPVSYRLARALSCFCAFAFLAPCPYSWRVILSDMPALFSRDIKTRPLDAPSTFFFFLACFASLPLSIDHVVKDQNLLTGLLLLNTTTTADNPRCESTPLSLSRPSGQQLPLFKQQ